MARTQTTGSPVRSAAPGQPGPGPSGDPAPDAEAGSTRDRILDIALDLFIEQGFDKTALRQIAEKLGFSKAALYYHFASKEDILMALHLRLHEVGREPLARLSEEPTDTAPWVSLFDDFISLMMTHRKLFVLHERNRTAFENLHRERHHAEHADLEDRVRTILRDPAIPAEQRVRMACALGAVMGGLVLVGDAFADVPSDDLSAMLRSAIGDILMGAGPVPPLRRQRAAARAKASSGARTSTRAMAPSRRAHPGRATGPSRASTT